MSVRRLLAVTLAAASCGLAAALPGTVGAAPAYAGTVTTAHPGDNLQDLMFALRPGDVLKLAPGTYNVGTIRVAEHRGTSGAPITVTAADPSNRPLIVGTIRLLDADYWRVSKLRVKAGVMGAEALWIAGGTGWIVSDNEFFDSRVTGGYSNVTIASSTKSSPRGFRFAYNCVHNAGKTTRPNQDHNIYVNFAGNSSTGGMLDHNLIFDHPNGVGVKLGNGGQIGALGPWGVKVENNTIIEGGRQILLHGNVRNNTIKGNLLGSSRAGFSKSPQTTIVYVNKVTTKSNRMEKNYMFRASMSVFDLDKSLVLGTGSKLSGFPSLSGVGSCAAYKTPAWFAYGRYGNGRY
ncbi:MAG: hypothetical protein U0Q15_14770 [Kineosporiaceae bacterium]